MKRIRRALSASIALGLAVTLALPAAAYAALPFTVIGAIMNEAGYLFSDPSIDGRYVAGVRHNDSTYAADVVVYDHQTGMVSTRTSPSDGVDQVDPAISGDRVAWVDQTEVDGEVYYDDLGDPAPPIRVTTDSYYDSEVQIDGNWIVWNSDWDIAWYNIETGDRGIATPDVATYEPRDIRVDRGRVVYWDQKETGLYGLYVYDLETTAEYTVTTVNMGTTSIRDTVIHGDSVAWTQWSNALPADRNIHAEDIRSGVSGQVTSDTHAQEYPSAFGDLLAWQDDRNVDTDIFAWWRPELGYNIVGGSTGWELYPDVYGHKVVYQYGTAPGADVYMSSADLAATRLAGGNRFETSALISAYRFPESSMAVIATGANFADALSASSLAGAEKCPLLLTARDNLPTAVADELDRLGVLGVFVVGGTSAVSDAVVDDLEDMGINVTRVAGINRYATARQVANYLIDIMGNENRPWRGEAFFCRGDDFADALAVAPHAYALGMPILLVQTNAVPADTAAAITTLSVDDGYVIGGTGAISAATKTSLDALCGSPTERWSGANRYETAAVCAAKGVDYGWLDYDAIGMATGINFPDALSGGAASGYYGSPIVLTAPTAVPPAVHSFFTAHRYDFGGMDVYGGTGAVNAATFTQLEGYLD